MSANEGLDERFPRDPAMLMSMVNMKLRDDYPAGLDSMCDDMGISRKVLEEALADAGFEYSPEHNKFW